MSKYKMPKVQNQDILGAALIGQTLDEIISRFGLPFPAGDSDEAKQARGASRAKVRGVVEKAAQELADKRPKMAATLAHWGEANKGKRGRQPQRVDYDALESLLDESPSDETSDN
jgi:hypothetical protein